MTNTATHTTGINDVFYPEMGQAHNNNPQLIAEYLYKAVKITALNGVNLKTNRSIKFQYMNDLGNKIYYVSEAGLNQLKNKYNIAFSANLD